MMSPGDTLQTVSKTVAQENINTYAEASGDHNPIHLDPDFAASTYFGRIVAHGMFVLAYISEMMSLDFGRNWLESRASQRTLPRPGVSGRQGSHIWPGPVGGQGRRLHSR